MARCSFCGSAYLIEQPPEQRTSPPQVFLPFALSLDEATKRIEEWLSTGLFHPGDLGREAKIERLEPIFVPIYLADCHAHSNWTASILHHGFKRVRRPIGFPDPPLGLEVETGIDRQALSGAHDASYPNIHSLASRGLDQHSFWSIADFDWSRLEPITAEVDTTVVFEAPVVDPAEAERAIRSRVEDLERSACRKMVPGEVVCELNVNTVVDIRTIRLAHVPVHAFGYRYRERSHAGWMNGVTGRIEGARPLSFGRIGAAVATAIGLAAAIVWLFRRRR